MRYVDSGSRDANQTLGAWLQSELTAAVVELRWQSGFFTSEPLGLLLPTLRHLAGSNTRLFAGGVGTANINLPVESMPTLRFGVLGRGGYPNRPRAEFDLLARYVGANTTLTLPDPAETNVMLYGYLQGESGHQNRRMLLPADVRALGAMIQQAGLPIPEVGHFALMEWPTPTDPEFRLSFLQPSAPLFQQAQQLFAAASNAGQLVGDGACWLPPGVSPPW